jgi:hypothetical protein
MISFLAENGKPAAALAASRVMEETLELDQTFRPRSPAREAA